MDNKNGPRLEYSFGLHLGCVYEQMPIFPANRSIIYVYQDRENCISFQINIDFLEKVFNF